MRHLILRIDGPDAGSYRCELLAGNDGDVSTATLLASSNIPAPFVPTAAPVGEQWPTADELRALLAGKALANEFVVNNAGHAMASLLESGALAGSWRTEIQKAWKAKGDPVRAALRLVLDIKPAELRELPWELTLPAIGADPLVRRLWTPVSRLHSADLPAADMQPLTDPLRFMIIVGCAAQGDGVEWEEELHHLVALAAPRLHAVDFELFITHRIREGNVVQRLRSTLGTFQPHIVHFIGHGDPSTRHTQAALRLFDATDKIPANHGPRSWAVADIVNAMAAAPPRLVFLNACRSGTFGSSAGVHGMADALMNAGVAAVVGMQGNIPSTSAAAFAAGFYEALLTGRPIDEAMVHGRQRIGGVSAATERDWAMPALVTGVGVDDVLRMSPSAGANDFTVRAFVDRRDHRRTLHARAEQAAKDAPVPGVFLIRGGGDMGKTSLVRYALEGCALRGRRVRYVSFKDMEPMNLINVLRHVRGPREDKKGTPIIERSLYAQFGRFNDALVRLLSGDMKVDKRGKREDDPRLHFVEGVSHEDTLELALDAFKQCMVEATANAPLVLALDDLGRPGEGFGISRECFTDEKFNLAKDLFRPIAERKASIIGDVRCVICVSPTDETQYDLTGIGGVVESCEVDLFLSDDFDLLAREYLFQAFPGRAFTHAEMSKFVTLYHSAFVTDDRFEPERFSVLADNVRRAKKWGP